MDHIFLLVRRECRDLIYLVTVAILIFLPNIAHAEDCTSISFFDHDWSEVGLPDTHRVYAGLDLSYDSGTTYAYVKILHGVEVTVGIDHGSSLTEAQRQSFANLIFNAFNRYWVIFNGFPFTTYRVLIMPGSGDSGAQGGGYIVYYPFQPYNHNCRLDTHVHELFHAWNSGGGGGLNPQSNPREKWFIEGITSYYEYKDEGLYTDGTPRTLTQVKVDFETQFKLHILNYYLRQIKGTADDISLINMGLDFNSDDTKRLYYYNKGALVAYLIDKKLNENGSNLDLLMRQMYNTFNYGAPGSTYTSEDVQAACETLAGVSFSDIFDEYVFGDTPLPMTSSTTFTFYPNELDERFVTGLSIPGDLNIDYTLNAADAILGLKVLAGQTASGLSLKNDPDENGKLEYRDIIYILNQASN